MRDDLAQDAENDSDEDADQNIVESIFPEVTNLNDDDIRDLFASRVGFMSE